MADKNFNSNIAGVSIECTDSSESYSGIKICDHYLVTHSTIVSKFIDNYFNKKENQDLLTDVIELERSVNELLSEINLTFKIYEASSLNAPNSSFISKKGNFYKFYINLDSLQTFCQLLTGDEWTFQKEFKKSTKSTHAFKDAVCLSSFVVIQTSSIKNLSNCLQDFTKRICKPIPGEKVFIDGCPFGANAPGLFLNSISCGIVGNVSYDEQIFITDARCCLGCEGSPVFAMRDTESKVCGMVISPFCSWNAEWVGLSFVATISPLVRRMLNTDRSCLSTTRELALKRTVPWRSFIESDNSLSAIPNVVELLNKCIVSIYSEDEKLWGSGIVVHGLNGIIVTCAHVINQVTSSQTVFVSFGKGQVERGRVLFKSLSCSNRGKDNLFVNDIAILQVTSKSFSIPLSKQLPPIATPLVVSGFPLFSTTFDKTPSSFTGHLAKIYSAYPTNDKNQIWRNLLRRNNAALTNDKTWNKFDFGASDDISYQPELIKDRNLPSFPFLLQTTCAVYPGGSGGPVVAVHPVKGPIVIGIVASYFKEAKNNTSYPHVSFATPSCLIAKSIERFLLTKDIKSFDLLLMKSEDRYHPTLIFKAKL